MSYLERANREFKAAGWLNDDGTFCDKEQEAICTHMLDLLSVFDADGHTGSTAPYAVELFSKLALQQPIVPLTGEDSEWQVCEDGSLQNIRLGRVFKDKTGRAFDIQGTIFWHWYPGEDGELYKSYYTDRSSVRDITFPYTPYTEYVERNINMD